MAVHYVNGGGGSGLFGTLLQAAALAVPGLGQVMPLINAGMSLMNGDPAGAVKQIGGMLAGGSMNGAEGAGPTVTEVAGNAAANTVDPSGPLMWAHRSMTPGFDEYYSGSGRQMQNRQPWGWGM